jgi:AcrR family transcriptional regulator
VTDDPVKPRRYTSPVREQRAQETRTAILDSAEQLFTTRGYVRTTLPAIAEDAGVSLATVKLAFRTKTDVLLNVWHRTIAGGVDDRVPVVDRDWFRKQFEIADPVERIRYSARTGLMIRQRIAGLVAVIQAGATVDDSLAELHHRMFEEHWQVVRLFTQRLADDGHLRPDLTVEEATDTMWTIHHVTNYHHLVQTRGWPPARYVTWLTETTTHALLPTHLHPTP